MGYDDVELKARRCMPSVFVAASNGINLFISQTITDSFVMQAGLSSRATKPVGHFVLAFSPHDASHLDDRILGQIANEYLQRMGYDDNQFVAFRHHDKEHPHLHLIVNRINFKGKCTKDSHEKEKNVKVCKELTYKYGLYIATGKERVKEQRLRNMDAIRYRMFHIVRESLTLARICQKLGNPVAIIHEQAHDMYDDARWDWFDSHNGFEVQHINAISPDFDNRFRFQAKEQMNEAPRMDGDDQTLGRDFMESLTRTADDICDAGNGAIHVGLTTLGAILFVPYQPAISAGGGSTSNKIGWGDKDKYKKRHRNRGRGFGRGRH